MKNAYQYSASINWYIVIPTDTYQYWKKNNLFGLVKCWLVSVNYQLILVKQLIFCEGGNFLDIFQEVFFQEFSVHTSEELFLQVTSNADTSVAEVWFLLSYNCIKSLASQEIEKESCLLLGRDAELFANCSLLVSFCLLLITFCSLLITLCLFLDTFCLLLVSFFSLVVTFCWLRITFIGCFDF